MNEKLIKPKELIIVAVMAVLLTTAGICFHQSFFRILPLFISLVVMILQSKVSRYAYLLGGLNSVLYAVVYLYYGLYGVAAQAFLFSFPMQISTFFNWKKNAEKEAVKFRRMNKAQTALCAVSYAAAWTGLYFVLKHFGSDYAVLDNTVTLLGIFTSVLTAFAYIEYAWLNLTVAIINIFLYIQVIPAHHDQVTYLIYGLYSLVCVSMHFAKARRIWKEQQAEEKEEASV